VPRLQRERMPREQARCLHLRAVPAVGRWGKARDKAVAAITNGKPRGRVARAPGPGGWFAGHMLHRVTDGAGHMLCKPERVDAMPAAGSPSVRDHRLEAMPCTAYDVLAFVAQRAV